MPTWLTGAALDADCGDSIERMKQVQALIRFRMTIPGILHNLDSIFHEVGSSLQHWPKFLVGLKALVAVFADADYIIGSSRHASAILSLRSSKTNCYKAYAKLLATGGGALRLRCSSGFWNANVPSG